MQGVDMKALFNLNYGMNVIGSRIGEKLNGQIANAVMQITANPMTIAVCLNKQNYTSKCLNDSGSFSVSVLEDDVPMTFIGQFGFKK